LADLYTDIQYICGKTLSLNSDSGRADVIHHASAPLLFFIKWLMCNIHTIWYGKEVVRSARAICARPKPKSQRKFPAECSHLGFGEWGIELHWVPVPGIASIPLESPWFPPWFHGICVGSVPCWALNR